MKKSGFTLLELLAVIVVLAVLATLGSRAIRSARIGAKKAQAMVEMKAIETAVKAYHAKYGKLPLLDADQGRDMEASEFDEAFSQDTILMLTGEDGGLNPAGIVFLEPQGASTNGVFTDPWGAQYLIYLDANYDNEVVVEHEAVTATLRRRVALLSVGLYESAGNQATNDVVTSWE